MLYKFKSRAAADLILLEPQGRQILEIIGKTPGPTGIVTAAQIPAALAALEAAVARDEARLRAHAFHRPAAPQPARGLRRGVGCVAADTV